MILCNTRAAADSPEVAANRLLTADRVLAEGLAAIADAMVPRLAAEVTLTRYPERVEAVRRMIFSNDPRGIAAASRGMARRTDATSLLPQIACPTLLIAGQNDQLVPLARCKPWPRPFPTRGWSRSAAPAISLRWRTRPNSTRRSFRSSAS